MKIQVTPTTLFFGEVGEDVLAIIDGAGFEIHTTPDGYRVSSTGAKLYNLIVELSMVYDIEIV